MLDLERILAHISAMTPSEVNTMLKDALTESSIVYTSDPSMYSLEDMLPVFDEDARKTKLEIDISLSSAFKATYITSQKHATISYNTINEDLSSYSFSSKTGSDASLNAA